MKKKCPDGKYYCYTDKKCKDIPRGFKVVGPAGMLRKENGHSVDDDSETKNGKKNGNGNGHSNGNGNGGAVSEDLRKWFGSGPEGGKGGGGWDRYNTKGERIGKCARGPGEGKPKCLSNEKASKMSKAFWKNDSHYSTSLSINLYFLPFLLFIKNKSSSPS